MKWINFSGATALCFSATILSSCDGYSNDISKKDPVDLVKAGDSRVCAHPAVIGTLKSIISKHTANDEIAMPLNDAQISALPLPTYSIDRISMSSFDQTVSKVSCEGVSVIKANFPGKSENFEKQINFSIMISSSDPRDFLVSTTDSIASDIINIGISIEAANQISRAEAERRERENLAKATSQDGTMQTPENNSGAHQFESNYSPAYQKCMESEGAKDGITSEILSCIDSELDIQDARLNRAYNTAMNKLSADQKSTLKNTQREWIRERDNDCAPDPEGGTSASIGAEKCLLEKTTRRAMYLETI